MERRKLPRKDWTVGKDDVGQAMLQWTLDSRVTKRREADPCARTFDFLERLESPSLALEDEPIIRERNPYNSGSWPKFAATKKR